MLKNKNVLNLYPNFKIVFLSLIKEFFIKFNNKIPFKILLNEKINILLINKKIVLFNKSLFLKNSNCVRFKNLFNSHFYKFFISLKIIGLGFKFVEIKNFRKNQIFLIKVGFSHYIFIKFINVKVFCFKNFEIFINGNYCQTKNYGFFTRLIKKPEFYKGKGIRFFNEKIKIKLGKRR